MRHHPRNLVLALAAIATISSSRNSSVFAVSSASSGNGTSGPSVGTTSNNGTAAGSLVGWFDCSPVTFVDQFEDAALGTSVADLPTAQCAIYVAPLCHAGVCTDARHRAVDVFVKRIEAASDPASKPNVWFLQGGPGAASPTMEHAMTSLYKELKGDVNVYTMDHRGTGRSTLLDCVASQVTTSGSPNKGELSADEVASCSQELQTKYGDLAAFSITSAATDLSTFISKFQTGSKTYVYGVSYGSALVERLMHLDTKEIVGYILDGVATTSGADAKDGMYMSNWDANFGEVGDRFLDLCAKEPTCGSKFPTFSIQTLAEWFATNATATGVCSNIFSRHSLKNIFGALLTRESTRGVIPAVLYRLAQCRLGYDESNFSILSALSYVVDKGGVNPQMEQDAYNSTLLRNLIVFSEMWEDPAPHLDSLNERLANASIATGIAPYLFPSYCIFTRDNSSACSAYTSWREQNNVAPIAYKKDKYWNAAATIPDGSSVLLMSGELDPETPHKYAERLLKVLNGTKKELVMFNYSAQGTLLNSMMPGAPAGSATCGMMILASYVRNGGDLSKLDKSCLGSLKMNFAVPTELSLLMLNTSEPFDGKYNNSHWFIDQPKTKRLYLTAFVIVSVVTAVIILGTGYLCFLKRKRQSAGTKSSEDDAVQCQLEAEVNDAATAHSPSSSGGQYNAATQEGSRA